MRTPDDVWAALSKMALRLINDFEAERHRRTPAEIADAALTAFRDIRHIEDYRCRLEAFVRDILDENERAEP